MSIPRSFTRIWIVVAAAALAAVGGALALAPEGGVPEAAPTQNEMASEVGAPVMRHVYRGHVPGRSGEIYLVPRPHRYLIGDWDLTTLGTGSPEMSTSHPNPWAYLSRVPIIFYGPRWAPEGREVFDRVDIADIAPTYARLLGMEDFEADGGALDDIAARRPRPKVIFTVVVDGGGWNALMRHPRSWPGIRALARRGTTYANATIGSAPSITGALHATFGTGMYPKRHRVPGNRMRAPNGEDIDVWLDNADPRYLEAPTLSELWDERHDNRAVVGTVSYEGWHLGMIGHGAQRAGGDRDVAVLWDADENEWWINEEYYELPSYLQVTDRARLRAYEGRLDPRDGIADGRWFGHTPDELRTPRTRPGTPAFVRFTGDAVAEVLQREQVGTDDITDLVWVEMKMPDYAGHAWNVANAEQADVLAETDRQIARFKDELDRLVGAGEYLFVVSADHGQQPLPEAVGGWRINNVELERDIVARFGDVVQKVTTAEIYLDRDALREAGTSADEIARFLGRYTIAANIPERAPGADRVPQHRLGERLFAGAFSTDYLQALGERKIASFGESAYPEGRLHVSPPGSRDGQG